jgi:molecular chaperone HscB
MYFEILELPKALSLDAADLDKRFYALSRKYHPDLYSRRPAAEQQEALDRSALLNDAYRTLKDPIKRAQYVLKSEGVEAADEPAPPELLEEMFELNELLEEGGELEPARLRFEAMKEEVDTKLGSEFKSWDQSHDRQNLLAIRGLLNRRKYITNLIEKTSVPDRI